MRFESKEISVSNEELGCEITFNENAANIEFDKSPTIDEILNYMGRFLMIQKTYAEDEFEEDYIHFESSDPDKCGELTDFEIVLSKTAFMLIVEDYYFEITINPDEKKFAEMKKVLQNIVKTKGSLIINDTAR